MVFSGSGYDRHDNENDDDDESGSEPEAGPGGPGSNDDFEYFALRFELLRRLLPFSLPSQTSNASTLQAFAPSRFIRGSLPP